MSHTLADPTTYAMAVPYTEFARCRRDAPVCWVDEPVRVLRGSSGVATVRGSGFWAVTRHETICAAARSPEVFSSAAKGAFLTDPRSAADLARNREVLINMDAPRHARLRRTISPAFTSRELASMRESIVTHARQLTDKVVAAAEFDAVADLAAELPLLVLADLLGMPRRDRGLLLDWSNGLVGFDDPEYGDGDIDRYRATMTEAFGYIAELAEFRRKSPGADLVSKLVSAEVDGRGLTVRELSMFWLLLVVAGNETTRHLISGGLLALIHWPDQARLLAQDPDLLHPAVEEMLRWVTPIMQFRRTATEDTDLDGTRIRAGSKVVLYFISANRDDRVFADPDRFDIRRVPNPHLAFGFGPHACIGARLAQLEAKTLFDCLRPQLTRLELAGPPVRLASNFVNGLKSMPIRFG
ncbi:cytochrome P450 [Nocardia sp. NPDC051321]|uniref:cytochrome P450 n=1 Tax=Nocardia sp. NPDC051321 TaxID=3364323 RepID=UPI0037B647BD